MSLSTSRLSRVLITSAILVSYLGGAFSSTGDALMNNISNSDIGTVAIEQSVQQEKSTNFLSSLFSIPTAHAGYDDNIYSKLKDIKGSVFESSIVKAYQKGIIKGYSDGTFKPDGKVSFVESLAILIKSGPKGVQVANYQTSSDTHWSDAYKALYNAQDKTNLRSFNNDDSITRDFAVYLMLRQIGVDLNDSDYSKIPHKFTDVKSNTKFSSYLAFANYVGISNGYGDGSFGVNKTVSRGELTTMAYRTLIDNKDSIIQKYNQLKGQNTTVQEQQVKQEQPQVKETVNKTSFSNLKLFDGTRKEVKIESKQQLQELFNTKVKVDTSNYPKLAGGLAPQPASRSWDSSDFYKAIYQMQDDGVQLELPLYLVPQFAYVHKVHDISFIDLDVSSLEKHDINNYPSLAMLVNDLNAEIDVSGTISIDEERTNRVNFNKVYTKSEEAAMLKDLVRLMGDVGFNTNDFEVKENRIYLKELDKYSKYNLKELMSSGPGTSRMLKIMYDTQLGVKTQNITNIYRRKSVSHSVGIPIKVALATLTNYNIH